MDNGAIFDPQDKSMVICAHPRDVTLAKDEDGRVIIAISNLIDGIEIVHEDRRLWWPV